MFIKLATGTLAVGQFKVTAHTTDSNDFIVYNKSTGGLSYDADGRVGEAATLIANVNDGLNLINADIFII